MRVWRFAKRTWDAALAFVAAVLAARLMEPTTIGSVTTELIAFLAIQSAIILPAMLFTAGLLRGEALTAAEIDQYQSALRRQMHFWIGLLVLDLVAVCFLIFGKAINWTLSAVIFDEVWEFGPLLSGVTVFAVTICLLRMIPFVRGVLSLLDLNGWLAKKAAEMRELEKASLPAPIPEVPLLLPPGYGKVLPHGRRRTGPKKDAASR